MTTDTTKTPADREALIEFRARAMYEDFRLQHSRRGEDDMPGWDGWRYDEGKAEWRSMARATLEAEEAAGLVVLPATLTTDQRDAIKAQPHSYMHSISNMWEAVKARNPYAKEG